MHTIKKYANRKMYDTVDKRYISMSHLAQLIQNGTDVKIIDNETGKDITATIVSQLIARKQSESSDQVPPGHLMQLLRKGGGTLFDYAKRYTSLWQNALTMAEDEIDKLVKLLVKDKELSEKEGSRLKKEIVGYTENLKRWIGDKVDQRVTEVMGLMNLATSDQVRLLTERIDKLAAKVDRLEKNQNAATVKSKAKTTRAGR